MFYAEFVQANPFQTLMVAQGPHMFQWTLRVSFQPVPRECLALFLQSNPCRRGFSVVWVYAKTAGPFNVELGTNPTKTMDVTHSRPVNKAFCFRRILPYCMNLPKLQVEAIRVVASQ